ncbi:MAG TPA: hypothetical protein V6C72_11385 [Chroococcales cyanobacterium]
MLLERKKLTNGPLLGEMLVEAGLVKPESLSEALAVSKRAKVPVGRILVMSGCVGEVEIDCAVKTQRLIKEGSQTRESARQLLKIVHISKVPFEEAQLLDSFGRAFSAALSQLGRLLLAAQVLSEPDLLAAADQADGSDLSLGRFLVQQKRISQELLVAAINCLILVRDKKLTYFQAVKVLGTVKKNAARASGGGLYGALLENSLDHAIDDYLDGSRPRLCDLLVEARLISCEDAAQALERSLETGEKSGRVLVKAGILDDALLETTLQLQKMIDGSTLSLKRAGELLGLCKEMGCPLESLLAQIDELNQIATFLRRGGFLDHVLVRDVAARTADFDANCGTILIREGLATPELYELATICHSLFRKSKLSEEQAFETLRISLDKNISPYDAMKLLDFSFEIKKQPEPVLLERTA